MLLKYTVMMFALVGLMHCSVNETSDKVSKDAGVDIKEDIGVDTTKTDISSFQLGRPELTRSTPEKCDDFRPSQNLLPDPNRTGCQSDEQCTEGSNGRCIGEAGFELTDHLCIYDECFKDDDCGQGTACTCGKDENSEVFWYFQADENRCVTANCRTDADCEDQFCKPQPGLSQEAGNRVNGFYCTTENDECRNDSDCHSRCLYWAEGAKWICMAGDP